MATMTTATLSVTIDAPFAQVARDLADAESHPMWATEFFDSPARAIGDGTYQVTVPRLGGPARLRIDADVNQGVIDLYLAPDRAPFGPPLPVRVVPNRDGVDVLFTLARFPGVDDDDWEQGLDSMRKELASLKARHEGPALRDSSSLR